jgi:hypothetical protein
VPTVIVNCDCGTHVKAMYEMDGSVVVRCPACATTQIVAGQVSKLWVEGPDEVWNPLEIQPLVGS